MNTFEFKNEIKLVQTLSNPNMLIVVQVDGQIGIYIIDKFEFKLIKKEKLIKNKIDYVRVEEKYKEILILSIN